MKNVVTVVKIAALAVESLTVNWLAFIVQEFTMSISFSFNFFFFEDSISVIDVQHQLLLLVVQW